ncbi:MAG: excinuclease ABC subunit UvrA [Candidatus Magasanikbacteria bacterium]|nr:excinuclease ABC subunit UvrA [Candidatus Magasanikbacteria bacterium]
MPKAKARKQNVLSVRGARVHNLKNVSLDLPKNAFIVMTGLSGSGKSSLAFDTIHAEGQRRYMESMSSYARQFMEMQDKPDLDAIEGLSPTIAIDQKTTSNNPRSTVGTTTEMYDFLRVLFARAGRPHCPKCDALVSEQSPQAMAEDLMKRVKKHPITVLAPVIREKKGEHKVVLQSLKQRGFQEVRFDGTLVDIAELSKTKIDKTKEHTIEVITGRFDKSSSLVIDVALLAVKQAVELANGTLIFLNEENGDEQLLSCSLFCSVCELSLPPIEPRLFSFNSPHGACPACTGLGTKLVLEPELVIPNKKLTIAQGAIKPWARMAGNQSTQLKLIEEVGKKYGFSINDAIQTFSAKAIKVLFYGTGEEHFEVGEKEFVFEGVLAMLETKHRETDSEYLQKELETYMRVLTCPDCKGARLCRTALSVSLMNKRIADLVTMPLDELQTFFELFVKNEKKIDLLPHERAVMKQVSTEVTKRLKHLLDVGLDYLTLDRSSMSLSGGESQRVRLAAQLGSELSGVIYILDEPSIGLHPRDNDKLIGTIKRLRDLGNTVIVVEHDEEVMKAADWIVDIGPGAGEYGGHIIAEGTLAQIKKAKDSKTGQYLAGKHGIEAPAKRRKGNGKHLTIKGASAYHLKNVDCQIPLGKLVCISGVSGSGKSTLILDILGRALSSHFYNTKDPIAEHKRIDGMEYIDKVVTVDQSPIGRTPRSNPATYTGVFTAIRDLFTEMPEAKARGFDAGKFSFNVKGGGRCEACSGDGSIQISMQFMPDVYVECHECHGQRYNAEALEVRYRGKTIADILHMTVEEAKRFFLDQPAIYDKIAVLEEVGLGYVRLGQSATTLSGGEAQRVKLSTELSRRSTGKTLYILDEPTTGLHFEDMQRLLQVLQALVDKGNTVLVIEHNTDIMKAADWMIDMGPDGGLRGGQIMAQGTPEEVAKSKTSKTAPYLRQVLRRT